jgi:hypothetical protein
MKEIMLSSGAVALVDDEDYELVSRYRWNENRKKHTSYAMSGAKKMHHFILEKKAGFVVDHINHNGLDCRRANLRYATIAQNNQNSRHKAAGKLNYKGVCLGHVCAKKPFRAQIRVNRKLISLGYFATQEAAALAYNEAAKMYFGDFACLNVVLTCQ